VSFVIDGLDLRGIDIPSGGYDIFHKMLPAYHEGIYEKEEFIMFQVGKFAHAAEDRRCNECYVNYPMKCACGGLIHAQYVDTTWDDQIQLEFSCDKCGGEYKYATPKPAYKKRRRSHGQTNIFSGRTKPGTYPQQ
jgi:hypothetical protein